MHFILINLQLFNYNFDIYNLFVLFLLLHFSKHYLLSIYHNITCDDF